MSMTQKAVAPHWPMVDAAKAGFDPQALAEAVALAEASETKWPRDMYVDGIFVGSAHVGDKPPYNQPMGPVVPRGGANGLILRGGKMVASWGDITRADMTFSIAKSYLAIMMGLAIDRGLVGSIDERVGARVKDGGFEDAQNAPITWRHLLEQTSEWQGTLFERPDSVDWHRQVGPTVGTASQSAKGDARKLSAPGQHFEYNDVRVNRLALALLRIFERPLPEVLRQEIMDPIGASDGWRWHGYSTSWVEVAGQRMQSVTGGGHWGGGLVIDSRDHARLGELIAKGGSWGGRQLLSRDWIAQMTKPSAAHPGYGLLWWLNTERALYPGLPESSVFALGGGSNILWVDAARDLVAVLRWVDKPKSGEILGKISAALVD